MKYICVGFIALILAACSTTQKEHKETAACMNYQHMMTAPMPSDAMERLKQKCIESRN